MPVLLLSFLKAHWRPFACAALVAVVFFAGRSSVHRQDTKIVTVEKIQWKDRIVTQVVEKKTEQTQATKDRVVYIDRIVHKDGSQETKEEIREVDAKATEQTDVKQVTRTEEKSGTREATQTITVHSSEPQWNLSLGLGAGLKLSAPFLSSPFVLVDVSHHFIGPFWLGGWGTLDINGKNPALGLSVSVTF